MTTVREIVTKIDKLSKASRKKRDELPNLARDIACWMLKKLMDAGIEDDVDILTYKVWSIGSQRCSYFENCDGCVIGRLVWGEGKDTASKPALDNALQFAADVNELLDKVQELVALQEAKLSRALGALREVRTS